MSVIKYKINDEWHTLPSRTTTGKQVAERVDVTEDCKNFSQDGCIAYMLTLGEGKYVCRHSTYVYHCDVVYNAAGNVNYHIFTSYGDDMVAEEEIYINGKRVYFKVTGEEGTGISNILEPFEDSDVANKKYVDSAILASQANNSYCTIPSIIHVIPNSELKIYFRNVLTREDTIFWIGYHSSITTNYYNDYVSIVANESGSYNLPWAVYDAAHRQLQKGQVTIKVTDKQPVGTTTAIVIGDSTVNAGTMTAKAAELYNANGGTLALCGTRGNGTHEGRGGWTAEDYCTKSEKSGIENPFYNNGFDFANYMNTNGYKNVQVVAIQLGINDIFAFREYYSWCSYDSTKVLGYMEQIISSIHSYNANIKIIINLPTLPNSDGTTFGNTYGTNQIYWVYRHNIIRFAAELQKYFANKANIVISASNCILDTKTQIRDGVHPTEDGYNALGQRLYEVMLSIVDGVVYIRPLLSVDRERVTTKITVATTGTRELDYNKCYDTSFGGIRSNNVSTNITSYIPLSNNSFSCTVTKNTGNGLEFPVELEAGKTYKLSWTVDNANTRAYLMKYNADTTYNSNVYLDTGAGAKTATFTAEEGFIYSICFPVLVNEVECTFSDISLVET